MDFANILFGGPCNRACPFCIGAQLPERVRQSNLDLFPLSNLDAFIDEVNRLGIRHVVLTGTTTDPLLYRHQEQLMATLRSRITTGADYSLHTNGVLLLRQPRVTALYDKVCLSFPSFQASTYARMMGPPRPPDLARIARALGRRLKVSCIVSDDNEAEMGEFLRRCHAIGVPRLVLRRLLGDSREFPPLGLGAPTGSYRGSPTYDHDGMEITLWHFENAETTSLNLFADGTLGRSYLLTRTDGFNASAPAVGAG